MKNLLRKIYDNSTGKFIIEIVFFVLPVVFLIRTFIFGLYQVPSESMETTFLKGERFAADKLSYWFRKPERGEIVSINDPKYPYSEYDSKCSWNYFKRQIQKYFNWDISLWTKRIIAKEGDHIKGVIENGRPVIYINGEKLDESAYVNKYPIILTKVKPMSLSLGENQKFIDWQYKSFDPAMPWDNQPFYNIDPKKICINLRAYKQHIGMPYVPRGADVKMPGTPKEGGVDIFEHTLGKNQYYLRGDNRCASYDSSDWGPLDLEFINGRIVYRILSIDTEESWLLIDILKNPIGFWKKIRWSRCFNFIK